MPSPIRIDGHANEQGLMIEWLAAYAATHADVRWSPPGSVLLDEDNEPEPDVTVIVSFIAPPLITGEPDVTVMLSAPPRALIFQFSTS